jgi:hypothetical protein
MCALAAEERTDRQAASGMQAVRAHDVVVEKPHVGPLTVVDVALHGEDAALEGALRLLPHATRPALAQRRRKLSLPQVTGFEDVIVDRDDERELLLGRRGGHGGSSARGPDALMNGVDTPGPRFHA